MTAPLTSHKQTNAWARTGKRVVDVLGGIVLLVIASPVLIISAAIIKLSSPGPVFFRQTRGGLEGKPFTVIKFRTMRAGRTPDPLELVPLDHAEITPIGRVLRRLKIDELPQVLNVLRGDMSIVGPRPTLLDQIEAYDPVRRQRLLVRPGLTGLAQVYSSANATWDERIRYDIAYVRKCSPMLDLEVLMRTLFVVVLGEARTARDFSSTRFARHVPPLD